MSIPAFVAAFFALFAMVNPIGTAGIFMGMTDGLSSMFKARAAAVTAIAVLCILVGSIFGAAAILSLFGISMSAFQVAGGIIVAGIGMSMLHGGKNPAHSAGSGSADRNAQAQVEAAVRGQLVVPLAMPILAGPGSIATAAMLAAKFAEGERRIGVLVAATAVAVSVLVIYAAFAIFGRYVSRTAQEIIFRFMGLIIVAIAVEMVIDGAQNVVTAYLESHHLLPSAPVAQG